MCSCYSCSTLVLPLWGPKRVVISSYKHYIICKGQQVGTSPRHEHTKTTLLEHITERGSALRLIVIRDREQKYLGCIRNLTDTGLSTSLLARRFALHGVGGSPTQRRNDLGPPSPSLSNQVHPTEHFFPRPGHPMTSYQKRQIWLITGASSGLGLATAISACKTGHTVLAYTRDPWQAAASIPEVEQNGGTWGPLDVAHSNAENVTKHLVEQIGGVDVLVNCAGCLGPLGAVEDIR
jgi:hypothetical protein